MSPSEIKALRKKLNLNQTDFGKKIGASLRSVQNYEKGNAQPSADKLMKLIELERDLGYNTKELVHESGDKYILNKNGNKYKAMPDGTFDVQVKELPFSAYASFVETLECGHVDEDLSTTIFNVDHVGLGHYMAFTVRGDSMNGGGIDDTPDKAKVLGRELQKHHWKDGFNHTKYGWIILCKQNIFHKDITDMDAQGNITLHSRNPSPEYSDFQLNLNNVYQIFKVIKRIF